MLVGALVLEVIIFVRATVLEATVLVGASVKLGS
jgi:hypothetical protein